MTVLYPVLNLPETWGLFIACAVPGIVCAGILVWALCRIAAINDDREGTR